MNLIKMAFKQLNKGQVATFMGLFAAISVIGIIIQFRFGSIYHTIAYIRGERLVVDETTKSFGEAPQGKRFVVGFSITNINKNGASLMGARSTCTCAVVDGLPLFIPGGETRVLYVTVAPRLRPEGFVAKTEVYTDIAEQPIIPLTIMGIVRVGSDEPSKVASDAAKE